MPAKKRTTGSEVQISQKKQRTARITQGSSKTTTRVKSKRTISAPANPSKLGWSIGMHLLISGSAIAVLILLGMVDSVTFSTLLSRAANDTPTTIGLEFVEPLRLSVLVARKSSTGYASIRNDSTRLIRVSVPLDWQRTEVSGAALSEIVSDEPVFGFVRFSLPAGSEIRFLTPNVPGALFFDTTSKSTAAISIRTIDLIEQSVSDQAVLLQKNVLAKLWEGEE